jgi:hypothetical protein
MSHDILATLIVHGPLYILAIATLVKSWRTHTEVSNGLSDRIIKGVGEEAKVVAAALAEGKKE